MGRLLDSNLNSEYDVYVMIGNGFDLECKLPTSYGDFLNFITAIDYAAKGEIGKLTDLKLNAEVKDRIIERYTSDQHSSESLISLQNNIWYQHFLKTKIKQGWIDFENEIAKVICAIEKDMKAENFTMEDHAAFSDYSGFPKMMMELIHTYTIQGLSKAQNGLDYTRFDVLFQNVRDQLLNELNEFIRGFEIYLKEFVEPIHVTPTENINYLIEKIRKSKTRRILTFNYTTTFERLLKEKGIEAEFCYVHGMIGDGSNRNQMVLGIDEHLNDDEIKDHIGFAPFRKYYQRIYKRTDNNYMNWLKSMGKRKIADRILYIFGHSIGITDKDIIESFVTARDMKTVVFYYDDEAFANQVSNMTAIIGKNEMINRTGGLNHTLEFREQTKNA